MGCDIHMVVELYDWVPDGKGDEVQAWSMVIAEPAAYGDRNYALFGALAGVRNHDVPKIADKRGVPEDASPETKKWSQRYGADGHSHSWVTLAEVLAYDWSALPYETSFPDWAKALTKSPARMDYKKPEHIRFVFWFDN